MHSTNKPRHVAEIFQAKGIIISPRIRITATANDETTRNVRALLGFETWGNENTIMKLKRYELKGRIQRSGRFTISTVM